MITDSTYFVADLYLDGLTTEQFHHTELSKLVELNRQIAIFEPEILLAILGEDLYAEYLASEATPTTAWTAFKAKMWDATNKVSPVANYVFFNYWPTYCIHISGVGATVSQAENTTTLDVEVKQRMVWNSMTRILYPILVWLEANRADYEHDDVSLDFTEWTNLTTRINYLGL